MVMSRFDTYLFIISPVLQAVAPLPLHPVLLIPILIPELHSDSSAPSFIRSSADPPVLECKELLSQLIVDFSLPLHSQKGFDLRRALDKPVTIAPDRVCSVGFGNSSRITRVPEVLSGLQLLGCCLKRERRLDGSHGGKQCFSAGDL